MNLYNLHFMRNENKGYEVAMVGDEPLRLSRSEAYAIATALMASGQFLAVRARTEEFNFDPPLLPDQDEIVLSKDNLVETELEKLRRENAELREALIEQYTFELVDAYRDAINFMNADQESAEYSYTYYCELLRELGVDYHEILRGWMDEECQTEGTVNGYYVAVGDILVANRDCHILGHNGGIVDIDALQEFPITYINELDNLVGFNHNGRFIYVELTSHFELKKVADES